MSVSLATDKWRDSITDAGVGRRAGCVTLPSRNVMNTSRPIHRSVSAVRCPVQFPRRVLYRNAVAYDSPASRSAGRESSPVAVDTLKASDSTAARL